MNKSVTEYTIWFLFAAFLLLFLLTAFLRLSYPFELEWMEGGTMQHVERILGGQPLYSEPSLEYTAYRYGPLYYLIGSLLAIVGGVSFVPLRLVSILSTIGCLVVIYRWIRVETGNANAALLGAGLFAATYGVSDAWFDLARVDMLFLFFFLLALYFLRSQSNMRGTIVAGLFAFLAFWSKQAALGYLAPIALLITVFQFRRGLAFVVTLAALIISSTLVWDVFSDGWYSFYVFELGRSLELVPPVAAKTFDFFAVQLLLHFVGACVLSIVLLMTELKGTKSPAQRYFFWVLLPWTVGLTWLVMMGLGSWTNTMLPMFSLLAIAFGLGWNAIEKKLDKYTGSRRSVIGIAVYILLILQFAILVYDPGRRIPTDDDRRAGEALVEKIRSIDGELLIPFHSYLAGMAGKKEFGHEMAIDDILKRAPKLLADSMANQIRNAIASGRFEAIILDHHFFTNDIEKYYNRAGPVFDDPRLFLTRSGSGARPEVIYFKK